MRGSKRDGGYALVAVVMILFMVLGLGVLAMVTSATEQTINTGLNESQRLFFYAEQGADRVLSHLHYLSGGLFTKTEGLGLPFRNSSFTSFNAAAATSAWNLDPVRVLNDKYVLYTSDPTSGTQPAGVRNYLKIQAYMDPQDLQNRNDRGLSRPVAITTRVTNTGTGTYRTFRAYARQRSVWDFAYYATNNVPAGRNIATGASGETCTLSDSTPPGWYACHPVFAEEDQVVGDAYIGNMAYTRAQRYDDGNAARNGRMFVRGAPAFRGQVLFRDPRPFSPQIGTSRTGYSQTKGGSCDSSYTTGCVANPLTRLSFKSNARAILPPAPDLFLGTSTADTKGYRAQADLYLKEPYTTTYTNSFGATFTQRNAWRIVLRNDLWTAGSTTHPRSKVASAIKPSIKDQVGPCLGQASGCTPDAGTMVIYRIPIAINGNPGATATPDQAWTRDDEIKRAAFYGDTMVKRNAALTSIGATRVASGSLIGCGTTGTEECLDARVTGLWATRDNTSGTTDTQPYDPDDINAVYSYMKVPTRNDTNSGIIFVEGDLVISGILKGQLTIVATGDIYLDHEIQYDTHPDALPDMNAYVDPLEPDMLALIAMGNIVIPNSPPYTNPDVNSAYQRTFWRDDWSDPDNSARDKFFPGAGMWDHISSTATPGGYTPVWDDDGNEELHGVFITYGLSCTRSGSGRASATFACYEPENSSYTNTDRRKYYDGASENNGSNPPDVVVTRDVKNFRSGFYATPRTFNYYVTSSPAAVVVGKAFPGRPENAAYPPPRVVSSALTYYPFDRTQGGNDSGKLRIIGAVIQNIPGRFSYDYVGSLTGGTSMNATCVAGHDDAGAGKYCNRIGFSGVTYQYDVRLKYLQPPCPAHLGLAANSAAPENRAPIGNAAWEIISWEEVPTGTALNAAVW